MNPSRTGSIDQLKAADRARAVLVPLAFLAAAITFLLRPLPAPVAPPPAVVVPASMVSTTPIRRPKLEPSYFVGGYMYRCNDCHRHIFSPAETDRRLTQHTEIALAHGINTRCFNCHNPENRNVFAGDGTETIPYDQPQRLCAKCHGPVYRDWLHGSHGRTNGYWNTSLGPLIRRKCVECHDPHAPTFKPLPPAPPPQFLRDVRYLEEEHDFTFDPLLVGMPAEPPVLRNGGVIAPATNHAEAKP